MEKRSVPRAVAVEAERCSEDGDDEGSTCRRVFRGTFKRSSSSVCSSRYVVVVSCGGGGEATEYVVSTPSVRETKNKLEECKLHRKRSGVVRFLFRTCERKRVGDDSSERPTANHMICVRSTDDDSKPLMQISALRHESENELSRSSTLWQIERADGVGNVPPSCLDYVICIEGSRRGKCG